jgi:hypothetical protein
MRAPVVGLVLIATLALSPGASTAGIAQRAREACPEPALSSRYVSRVDRALRAGQDLWGNELLAAPGGPTYERVARYVRPLLLARAAKRSALTDSGVHYLAFTRPVGDGGAGAVALHVADGSQILWRRIDGPSLTVGVGRGGRERYGSCLARLAPPALRDGYLPVLETRYVDEDGVRYRQESFAGRTPETASFASFVRLTADARASAASGTEIRLTPGVPTRVGAGSLRTVYIAWQPPGAPRTIERAGYETARQSVADYWERRLTEGASISVPEKRVRDATRNLLIQNLGLTWRYSLGNAYEQFSFPEGVDVAQVMGAYGFSDVSAAILHTSLTRRPTPYPNWKMGQKLVGSALHYRLFRDRAYIDRVTPVLRRYVEDYGRQLAASPRGLLGRERYSSDIPDSVYGLHSQAIAWQGLRSMAWVWERTERRSLAARCRTLASRLEGGLRKAVRASETTLPDGSLFIPAQLLDGVEPYDTLTSSRLGSYWNLVVPYALASGLFAPGSREAEGSLAYMLRHGSRLLGLVRAGAYALYGRDAAYPVSGTDQVYGLNVSRFLADNDRPDQLVLSLYGQLAAAMTQGTFVAGEAASIAPLPGTGYRAMYLPPNGASNGSFLETLRLMVVHEVFDGAGRPRGLELAHATPRAWLRPGGRVTVRRLPTSFGPISFSIEARARSVNVTIDGPARARPAVLRLRLRLPGGQRMTAVLLGGRRFRRFDPAAETIDLSGRAGRLELVVAYGRG